MRGSDKSSANLVVPVTLAVASTLRSACPTTFKPSGAPGRRGARPRASAPPIQRLHTRRRILAAQPRRRELDRLVDLDVARAAAEVAGEGRLDVLARRSRIPGEQRFGCEEKGGRAVAALRGAQLGEGVLERMQCRAAGHAFHRAHPSPRAGEPQHQTGEDRRAVEHNGAGAALAQLAAVLRAREVQVLAQHLEQRLMRREGHLDGLAVQLERDLRFGGPHGSKRNLDKQTVPCQLWAANSPARLHLSGDASGTQLKRGAGPGPAIVGLAFVAAVLAAVPGLAAQDYRARALAMPQPLPPIAGHNDLPDAIREHGGLDSVDFAKPQPTLMTDIPRLRAGGVGAQFWAAYVPVTTIHRGEHPAVYALEQIDLVHRLCHKYRRTFAPATTAADVERNFKAGQISFR